MRIPIICSLILAISLPAAADEFQLQDGRKLTDQLVSITDGVVTLKRGKPLELALFKLLKLAEIGATKSQVAVHLTGGDVVHGKIGKQLNRGLTIESKLLGELRVKLRDVQLIDFGGVGQIPEETAKSEDYLYAINKQGRITRLKGALASISPERVSFVWKRSGRTYKVPLSKIRALRLGRTDDATAIEGFSVKVTLTDGSTLTGQALAIGAVHVDLHHTTDRVIRFPRTALARIRVTSDWVIYLANEKPVSSSTDRLYGADKLLPVYRKNKSIWGGSLAPYTSGIGTYGTTLLHYEIKSRYKTFEAAIWVARIEQTAGIAALRPQGEVIFRIHGDGRKLYDSGLVRAGDKPKQIKVDVTDVRRLTLEVNRGPGWGVGDAANWGNPRVHK